MSVTKMFNRTLNRCELNITHKYVIYMESINKADLDRSIQSVVESDMYTCLTDSKPEMIKYNYTAHYVSCESSYDDWWEKPDAERD